MEPLVTNPDANELKEIHPLIEAGLWIFGPEYEGSRYLSNRTLQRALNTFFEGGKIETPRNRPDFIVLPDGGLLDIYASDSSDEEGREIPGFERVLIIELKKGDSTITMKEMDQARDYAIALRRSGHVPERTSIKGYVIGTKVDSSIPQGPMRLGDDNIPGQIRIHPINYSNLLQAAQRRTFNLDKKIRESKGIIINGDQEIEDVLAQKVLDVQSEEKVKS